MSSGFVHLRLHTEFSLVDGLIPIKSLMKTLPEKGMSAVAVTDFCNLFAVVKVFQAAVKSGIKPILGCDVAYQHPDKPHQYSVITLLCQNEQGYRHLTQLVSRAYQEGQFQGQPRVRLEWIAEYAEGLIALSGGVSGDIAQAFLAQDEKLAYAKAKYWQQIFPSRFYIEIQRTNRPYETQLNQQLQQLAHALQLPLVATNDVRFLREEDFDAHEARVCIHEGYTLADPRRQKKYSSKQYLRSADEMATLFADMPHAIENTIEISKRCSVMLDLGKNYLPDFPTPDGISIETYLSTLAQQGLNERLSMMSPQQDALAWRKPYDDRLNIELHVINSMGFAGYFLIVADFIQWAKQNDVPVGPGRGSGAGSLVAYALKITDLDPLQYELLFERFLNPERVSMPDFDIDFCMEGRDRVIDYVAEKYGRQSVSQIITFGTMAAKAVVRDVGRVLGHPYGFVDKLAKMIPFELGMTLQLALEQAPELKQRYEEEEDVRELLDLAMSLEGLTRNAGKHAGGVVIAPSELTDFSAIYCEQGANQIVSQLDKDDVEAVGLVKFDFLGLRTLTIIHWALKAIHQYQLQTNPGVDGIDIHRIAMHDEKTFDLLKACKTTAVFQLESRGMKELIHRLQPDCFEDIIALVALFRPGPLQSGMVDDFIDRKHGRAQVVYSHPDLEPILKPTYGVILYQEQVMQIAQVLAGYTLGGADLLRRAMGKKKPEEMAKQRTIFTEGAVARGVDEQTAQAIFDLMEKFAGYGFNKSHSAAYALVAYQTAWLKTHHQAAFMSAVLSSDMDNTDKVVIFMKECRDLQLKILPPSINRSEHRFTIHDEHTILYGLGAIKGVGSTAIQAILSAREQGPFTSLFNLCRRVDLRKVNRRVLEALIACGGMDEWGIERAVLQASIEKSLQLSQRFHQDSDHGQHDLFDIFSEDLEQDESYVEVPEWSIQQRLSAEKETLGYYLSGHPIDPYQQEFALFAQPMHSLQPQGNKKVLVCGLVRSIRKITTKRGKLLVILGLEARHSVLDVVVFSEIFEPLQTLVQVDQVLLVDGPIAQDDYSGGLKMTANMLYSLSSARTRFAKALLVKLSQQHQAIFSSLQSLLVAHPGECVVQVEYTNQQAQARMTLDKKWCVDPSEDLLTKLRTLLSRDQVQMIY